MEVLNGLRWPKNDDAPTDASADDDFLAAVDPDGPADPEPLAADPKPAKRNAKAKPTGGSVHKATAAEKRQIEDALNLIQLTIGGGLSFRDPHCGGAILDHHENVSRKAVPIIARNPTWVAWFCGSAGWLDVFALIMAFKPVAGAFWGHHVSKSIGGEGDGDGGDLSQFAAPDLA